MSNLDILFQAPIFSVQLLLDGLLVGAIFALAAYGMALLWGVMNIINIAQGDFVILGGYVTLVLYQAGIHPLFGVPVAAVVLFLVGWAIYRAVIFRVVDRDLFISILATFGISILLQQLMDQMFGADIQTAEPGLGTMLLFDNVITVGLIKVVAFIVVLVLATVLAVFLKKSRLGQAIRATAQNARAALGRRMSENAAQRRLLEGTAELFGLDQQPRRIEVYDNSHISGSHALGAMIVSGPEGLVKNAYRKFNIKDADIAAGDDYAMMREVLRRRFARAP